MERVRALFFWLTVMTCISGFALAQEADETGLEAANPDIDFDELIVGISIELMSPDEFADDCECSWGVSNELAGAFNPTDSCETQYIALTQGEGQIELEAQCPGEPDGILEQDFRAIRPAPQISFTGSGCRLIRR